MGWLETQIRLAQEQVATWPAWLRAEPRKTFSGEYACPCKDGAESSHSTSSDTSVGAA